MDNQQLIQRIEALEKEIQNLKQSSTIPYEVVSAFSGRGFFNENNFIIAGQTEVNAFGTINIPIKGANKYSMAFVSYANFPDVNATGLDGYIESTSNGYQLHIEGTTGKRINYVVFLNNFIKLDIAPI